MKASELKQLIKECVKSVIQETDGFEPYDAETDQFATGPRDRTEPVEHDYDEKEEIKLINDILVHASNGLKKTHSLTDTDITFSFEQIQKTCLELLKMHGAK